MEWDKEDKDMIERQILEYERKLKNVGYSKRCIFCKESTQGCSNCPNKIITEMIKGKEVLESCFDNYYYFIEKFNLSTKKRFVGFCENIEQVEFRIMLWKDALNMPKKEFREKYR